MLQCTTLPYFKYNTIKIRSPQHHYQPNNYHPNVLPSKYHRMMPPYAKSEGSGVQCVTNYTILRYVLIILKLYIKCTTTLWFPRQIQELANINTTLCTTLTRLKLTRMFLSTLILQSLFYVTQMKDSNMRQMSSTWEKTVLKV
jgi:hypothetical protein